MTDWRKQHLDGLRITSQVLSESRALHLAALASIAIAQPLFDLLGQAPEFLLAHDLGPSEILAVVVVLGAGLPLACALAIMMLARVHARTARVAATVLVAFFVTLIVLYAVRNVAVGAWLLIGASAAAGASAAICYHRSVAARSFASWLAPGIILIPALFLLRPGVQSLLWPQEHVVLHSSKSDTPVVFVVFDGMPLTALLDDHDAIDRSRYPAFAALADQSTWYRNATTVSDYTQWAVPAIVSGRYPTPRSLPIASDHPETLFTLLGSSYAVEAQEPISRLCPQNVCDHGGEGITPELMNFGPTLSIAYLHAILPEPFREQLPAVNQGWAEGIPPSEKPGDVWLRTGDKSRRGEALTFINSIGADGPQPSLHFVHVLLPHIPLVYLPEGQRYGTERSLPGLLDTRDRWVDDEWAVTQGYRRFLLQVGFVDTLLGQLVDRLKKVGLYDRALVVVTSDHGGSFVPGRAFRRFTKETAAEIAPVPLFIKAPHQRTPSISDRNVETIDILPTVADMLDIDLPWQLDGVSALANSVPRVAKTIYHDNAKRVMKLPAELSDAIDAVVDRKIRLFGSGGNPYLIPRDSPHRELIGRAVDEFRVSNASEDIEFALDVHGDFSNISADGRFLPAQLSGRARWRGRAAPAVVAVAIDGIVRSTTWTYRFDDRGEDHTWSLVLPPDAFHSGENQVEIFMVRDADGPVLYRTHFSSARPVDLLSNAASYGMGVTYDGLYDRDGTRDSSWRWTNGAATILVPRNGTDAPQSMRITLATAGPEEKGLVINVNGCEVFEGRVPPSRWTRIFAMPDCDGDGSTAIHIRSRTHHVAGSERALGVAVERIDLLKHPWPPGPSLPEADRRSQIRFADRIADGDTVPDGSRLTVAVVNQGASVWAVPAELGHENGAIRLGVLWFRKGQTDTPAAVQRIELPHALVPGDSVEVAFELAPPPSNQPLPPGEYEAWIGLLQEGGAWFYTSGDSVRKLRVVHDPRP